MISAICYDGFRFNGRPFKEIPLTCNKETDKFSSIDEKALEVGCIPDCMPSCLNGGICIGPQLCQCANGFEGERCQIRHCEELPRSINAAVYMK